MLLHHRIQQQMDMKDSQLGRSCQAHNRGRGRWILGEDAMVGKFFLKLLKK